MESLHGKPDSSICVACALHMHSLIGYAVLQIAKRQGVVNPENTFFSVKRFIGRKMAEVGSESQQVPYRLADSSGAVKIKSSNAGKDFSPEEISAQVLRKLVDDAAKFLNDKVPGLSEHDLHQQCRSCFCSAANDLGLQAFGGHCPFLDHPGSWCA